MLRTRFSTAVFVLAAVFLTAAQVQADSVHSVWFNFKQTNDTGFAAPELTGLADISNDLRLRAWENDEKDGINFQFISTWVGDNGRGQIYANEVWTPTLEDVVFLTNSGLVFSKEPDNVTGPNANPLWVLSGGLQDLSSGDFGAEFSLKYDDMPSSLGGGLFSWDHFIKRVEGEPPFGFKVFITGDGTETNAGAFVTDSHLISGSEEAPTIDDFNATPEPATLLILGGGLAGLGIAVHRRKK